MRICICNILLLFVAYLLLMPIMSHAKVSKISNSNKNCISLISHNDQTGIAIEKIKDSCGVNSSYIILNLLNKNPDYPNLYKRLLPTENSKVSIADLERVLSEYNIKVHTLRLRPSQLYDNPNCLFIMYTPPPEGMDIGHFSVIRVIDEENVQIIDPPYPPRILKKSDWVSNDKIIFIAVGDNFNPPFEFDILKILPILMIISGVLIILYDKFFKLKTPSTK